MAEKAVATEGVGALGRLSAAQTAKLGEFGGELKQSALDGLSTTLDKKLDVSSISAGVVPAGSIAGQFQGMFVTVAAELKMEDGSTAPAILLVGEDEASALFNIAPDGDENDYKAKLEEAVQTGLTDLSDFLTLSVSVNSGAQLQFGVNSAELRNLAMTPLQLPNGMAGDILNVSLPVSADGGPAMDVAFLMSVDALAGVLAAVDPGQAVAAPAPARPAAAPAAAKPQPSLTPLPTGPQEQRDSVVRPAQFTSFATSADGNSMTNIDLILDVQLRVTVELGRKLMSVRDILALGPGSVVELDKVAGEPVDVLVNDRLIATGEVVVADDNFGVRITDIVNPAKRLSSR